MHTTIRKISYLLLFFINALVFSQQNRDSLCVVQYSDSIMIWHKNTLRNCCSKYFMDVSMKDTMITIIEKNVHSNFCDCLCLYDLSVTLFNLKNGIYTAAVFSDSIEGNKYFGSITFQVNQKKGATKPRGDILYNQFQSDCKGSMAIHDKNILLPEDLDLIEIYPNPFNASTTIQFKLVKREFVDLTVYNSNGRLIATLLHQEKDSGIHQFIWDIKELPSGLYFINLKTNSRRDCKKAIYLK